MAASVMDSMKKLQTAIFSVDRSLISHIQKPPGMAVVSTIRRSTGLAIPPSLQEFYNVCGGIDLKAIANSEWNILAPRDVPIEREVFMTTMTSGQFKEGSRKPKGLKHSFWSERYLPVATNEEGDCIAIDLDPGLGGTRFQVVHFMGNQGGSVIAPDFRTWFERTIEEARHNLIDKSPYDDEDEREEEDDDDEDDGW